MLKVQSIFIEIFTENGKTLAICNNKFVTVEALLSNIPRVTVAKNVE